MSQFSYNARVEEKVDADWLAQSMEISGITALRDRMIEDISRRIGAVVREMAKEYEKQTELRLHDLYMLDPVTDGYSNVIASATVVETLDKPQDWNLEIAIAVDGDNLTMAFKSSPFSEETYNKNVVNGDAYQILKKRIDKLGGEPGNIRDEDGALLWYDLPVEWLI